MRLRIENSNSSLLWAGALGSAFAGALLLWVSMSQSVGIGGESTKIGRASCRERV